MVVELLLLNRQLSNQEPMDILALLHCLQPCLSMTTIRQLRRIALALLTMTGRVTMAGIARWSHRLAWLSARTGAPGLYLQWARPVLAFYRALAWSHGRLGGWIDRVLPDARRQ